MMTAMMLPMTTGAFANVTARACLSGGFAHLQCSHLAISLLDCLRSSDRHDNPRNPINTARADCRFRNRRNDRAVVAVFAGAAPAGR